MVHIKTDAEMDADIEAIQDTTGMKAATEVVRVALRRYRQNTSKNGEVAS